MHPPEARRHRIPLPAWQVWVWDLGAWQRFSVHRWRIEALQVGARLLLDPRAYRTRFTRTLR